MYVNALIKHKFIHSLCLSPLFVGSREKEKQRKKIPKNKIVYSRTKILQLKYHNDLTILSFTLCSMGKIF